MSMVFKNLPEKLVQRLMPFQRDGVRFAIEKEGRCLIADEMGLGKTLQAISVAYYYKNEWPLLIIVPSSLRYSWIEEFEKWLPDVNPGDINLVQSGNDVSDIATSQVTISTFGLLSKGTSRILREGLMNQGFKVVIVDESHYIRNSKTVSAKTVVPLIKNANRRILLSGTPALSRPVELYPQIDAVCPGEFGTWWNYTAKFCDAKMEWFGKMKRRNVNGASNLEELQQKLSERLMIRREKNQVLTQLPPKQRQRVLFELKDSDLKKEIRQAFDELRPMMKRSRQDNFEVFTRTVEPEAMDTSTLALIQRLYRLSGTAKIGPAKEYIEMLCDNRKLKFLVFAYHHDMMNGLSESLHDKKVKFIRIDGETPPSERPHLVHQYQSDPDTRVAILSILAAGVGLTFTAATVVVFAEMYWTPGTMVQCEDRAHRIGQTSCVAVHYLVAKDTMDEWVWSAVCKKTLVTSTTLTGRKRKMEALEGDSYQVDVLSNADVWVPTANSENTHLTQYFETALDSNQKSILHFFSPSHLNKQKKLNDVHGNSNSTVGNMQDGKEDSVDEEAPYAEDSLTPVRKRRKIDSEGQGLNRNEGQGVIKPLVAKQPSNEKENAIIIDSDEDDFVDKKSASKKSSSGLKKKKNDRHRRTVVSPKSSLEAMFERVKNERISKDSIDLVNDETAQVEESENPFSDIGNRQPRRQEKVRGKKETSMEDGQGQWNCSLCTYLNHKDLKACEMCETPQKSKAIAKSIEGSSKIKDGKSIVNSDISNSNIELKGEKQLKDEDNDSNGANFVDDTLDFDPGVEPDLNGNSERNNKPVEMEIDTEIIAGNGFGSNSRENIDKECVNLIKTDDKDGTESGQTSDTYNTIIDDKPKSADGYSKLSGEESERNISEKSESLRSKYFHNSYQTPSPVRIKKKEIVIESKLNLKNTCTEKGTAENVKSTYVDKGTECVGKGTPDGKGLDGLCNRKTNDKLVSPNVTPTSGKKYRFKSVRNRPVGLSPVLSSPVSSSAGYFVGGSAKRESHMRITDDNTDKVSNETEDRFSGQSVTKLDQANARHRKGTDTSSNNSSESVNARVVGENIEDSDKTDQAGETNFRNSNKVNTDSKMQVDTGEVAKPSNGQVSKDYSFSSPEFDEMLAAQNEEDMEATDTKLSDEEKRVVDLDNIPVYLMFKYQCSKYTDRIYLLTQEDEALNLNFIPSDVQFGNDDGLPDILLHPDNLRLVQRFVREWQSLTETKKRLIVKFGQPFISPLVQYEKLKSCKSLNVQRHKSKADTSRAAHQKAKDINGSVRIVSKHSGIHNENSGENGLAQTVTEDGTPLCLQCFQPYTNQLITKATIQDENNAWSTRFCSRKCSQEYWMVSNNDYIRDQVFEVEHGVCQMCQFDAHSVFKHVRDTTDQKKRAEIITKTRYNSLTVKVKEQMVRKPAAGQFWHVDHIVPVWEGGGQCDIDNLRTLCIMCHQKVTARQAAKRATARKLGSAVNSGDISAFFQRN